MSPKLQRILVLAKALAPALLAEAGLPPELVDPVVNGITEAAKFKDSKTGAERLTHAVGVTKAAIATGNVVDPGLIDAPLAEQVITGAIADVYDTAKLVAEARQHRRMAQVSASPTP